MKGMYLGRRFYRQMFGCLQVVPLSLASNDSRSVLAIKGTVKLTNLWTYSAPWTHHKLLILRSSSDRFRLQTQSILLNLTVPP